MEFDEMNFEIRKDYKPVSGKLIRLYLKVVNCVILDIKICGDFFIYPEESIFLIEGCLKNQKILNMREILTRCVLENKITIIGFCVDDLWDMVFSN